MPEQIQRIIDNLRSFGPQRLAMMGGVAALVIAIIAIASIYLNRPAYETLYVGLERSDVNQIGLVLGEAGIDFDVASDGTTLLVTAGKTSQARMLLAEKGLPTSTNAGYELFDNVGSLGLTTFMQQITRIRALEGEIARTIQSIAGIRAARVHVVLPERGSFRREEQKPTASVVIRASSIDGQRAASAIRHLVAAAVPGLNMDSVTVLDSNGTLLASGDDPSNSSMARSITVEQSVASNIEANIRRALAPYLGPENFRASVRADVNTDSRQIEETIFDPNSRVERSVQVVRSNDSANQRSAANPTTVEQNLPTASVEGSGGAPESSEQSERREEITNYELNSKRIATVSNGYSVSKLSIAVVVNQARLRAILGDAATEAQVNERVADIQKLVVSASGFDQTRGDMLEVSAVEFMAEEAGFDAPGGGVIEQLTRQSGTMINAAAFVLVVFLVVWFGIRPMTAAIAGNNGPSFDEVQRSLPSGAKSQQAALTDGSAESGSGGAPGGGQVTYSEDAPDDIRRKIKPAPQERLARMVDLSEERTAQILRKWAAQEAS
ncbi:flagellar basal-body MS-ring/collar protein FliF [Mesorhizobium sp. Z1-4]|uniref:flagellar basal-body MS-ring/collar protein FliF n=1 Tax=Mesorhizobium sp. Z1-4 TaxID=2448478 RepID=UPI000FD70488|nr:flagellar basal-body MS-ring/collar protein FliF [Mesorhizobium sp. Z1-4]